ncbi:MAG: S8 family serine peptidase [Pseudomonadota bacterium]
MEYDDYPWHFFALGILDSWNKTKGEGIVIDLIDSWVDFSIPPLINKDHNKDSELICYNNTSQGDIHGTAMVGLMVAHECRLPLNDTENIQQRQTYAMLKPFPSNYCSDSLISSEPNHNTRKIAGIAPESLINSINGLINVTNVHKAMNNDRYNVTTDSNVEVLKSPSSRLRTNISVINLSGGQQKRIEDFQWNELVSNICLTRNDILIIAAVGNEATKITTENYLDAGIYPASLHPQVCKNKSVDPIIRVGAVNNSSEPTWHHSSNYGKNFVDISAPGTGILIIIPGGYLIVGGGTSEATAITSGTAALLLSRLVYGSSYELRDFILNNTITYDHLKPKVANGRVLHTQKLVDLACFKK